MEFGAQVAQSVLGVKGVPVAIAGKGAAIAGKIANSGAVTAAKNIAVGLRDKAGFNAIGYSRPEIGSTPGAGVRLSVPTGGPGGPNPLPAAEAGAAAGAAKAVRDAPHGPGAPGHQTTPEASAIGETRRTSGLPVEPPQHLGDLMKGAPLKPSQEYVSWPVVRRYYDRLANGERAPAITVDDGGNIVNGHHRYVAGWLHGTLPETRPANPARGTIEGGWHGVDAHAKDFGNR